MENLGEYNITKKSKPKFQLSQVKIIMLGFMIIITVGTILLMLPVATKSGEGTGLLNAAFTATSATCVTGLAVFDTVTQWSLFGQIVIIIMIQIGGLGFITLGVFLMVLIRRKVSLKQRELVHESINTLSVSGMVRLTKKIIIGTAIFEGSGAILLSFRFIPRFGVLRGIFYSIFHSISAFCNAGFDLLGGSEPYSSFSEYYNDWYVNLILILLILIGGIGFIVWDDISVKGIHFKKYLLQTKIVITATIVLLLGSAVLFFIFEYNNLCKDMSLGDKILTSLFSSATARTAGFNTIDTGGLSNASKMLNMILMFIGGCPGSTAGGVKTTTIVVLLVFLWSMFRGTHGSNIFGRRLEETAIRKASTVFTLNLFLAIIGAIIIMGNQQLAMSDVLFEVFSAIGTVGMTTGVTRSLTSVSKIVIMVLMYCGRVGSLSFALFFTEQRVVAPVKQPIERITIG